MRGRFIPLALSATLAFLVASHTSRLPAVEVQPAEFTDVYRLLANGSNDHVYTVDPHEVNVLTQQGTHIYEGVGFRAFTNPLPGTVPLYRYLRANGMHLLDTQRPARGDRFAQLEAILGYVAVGPSPGLSPLHAWVHPQWGLFFYTTHPQGELAVQNGYVYLGVLGCVAT